MTMSKKVSPIPEGWHTLSPSLIVRDAAKAIEFYQKAFGAKLLEKHAMPDGKTIMHAALKIGDSIFMLADEFPEWGAVSPKSQGGGGNSVTLHLYVEDADASFQRAVSAGATVKMPLADQFWGDRYGKLTDPFGYNWSVGMRVREVSPAEMEKAAAAFAASPADKKRSA
jgi:PhnB protein